MRRPAHRPFVLIRTVDQWRRCAHEGTALDLLDGEVYLAEQPAASDEPDAAITLPTPVGMAFDRHCRLFRSEPARGQIREYPWSTTVALDPVPPVVTPVFTPEQDSHDLFADARGGPLGEFVSQAEVTGPLDQPTGLAVDGRDRLFVWEAETGALLVWDLEARRLRERKILGRRGPVDLAWIDGRLIGVGPSLAAMLERSEDGRLRLRSLPAAVDGVPARVSGDSRGRTWLLLDAGALEARVCTLDGALRIPVPGADDFVFLSPIEGRERLVVARGPGRSFATIVIDGGEHSRTRPLAARGYDGRGLVRTPDDRVAYVDDRGRGRHAIPARVRHLRSGRVIGFRLDAGEFHRRWGRIFIEACVPPGTELRVAVHCTDDPPDDAPIPRTPPANAGPFTLKLDGQPPLPPAELKPASIEGALVERSDGRELPWTDPDGALRHTTWEAPVHADPGRYLWVFLELRGNSRRTPRVRSIRVESLGHPLLERLPAVYARDPVAADFVWRFLAIFDGALHDLELRTALRHAIFDPQATPASFLPWLGDLLGMSVDRRWPVAARRRLIAAATSLFRARGTVPGLRRMLELYLELPVEIVEHFRVRGLGGAIVGADARDFEPLDENPGAGRCDGVHHGLLGAGFRVGGAIGEGVAPLDLADLDPDPCKQSGADGFMTHAHRFTVVVPASLTREQREVVEHILEHHRPAHTLYQLCTLDAGMRVGVGLYLELSTLVGLGAGFSQLRVGASVLGREAVIGRPQPGTQAGVTRLGEDSHVG